jgi:hypothetical protein
MATTEGCTCCASSATSHQHAVSAAQYSGSLQQRCGTDWRASCRCRRQPYMPACAMLSSFTMCMFSPRRVQMLLPRNQSTHASAPVRTACACHRRQAPARAARRWAAGCLPPLQGPPAARPAAALSPQRHRLGLLPLRCPGCLPGRGLPAAAGGAAAGALLPLAALHRLPHPGTAPHRPPRPVAAGWRSTAPA